MTHLRQTQAPQGWSKILLYLISGFIPIVGLVLCIVYLLKPDRPSKMFGVTCLIFGLCLWPIGLFGTSLVALVFFGSSSAVAPFIYTLF
ncbi:MAG: DUF5989 family protein [bacterium]